MGFFTGGGSQVGSAQINDGSIVNADVNAAAAIAQSKLGDNLGDDTDICNVELSYAATHSLTTDANTKVLVIASFRPDGAAGLTTAALKYNGVTKHSASVGSNSDGQMVTFMYAEKPGAATANITLTTSAGTLLNPCITVLKFK